MILFSNGKAEHSTRASLFRHARLRVKLFWDAHFRLPIILGKSAPSR